MHSRAAIGGRASASTHADSSAHDPQATRHWQPRGAPAHCFAVTTIRLALLPLIAACTPFAADERPVTAQRPLLSADTATVPDGEHELEVGTRIDHDDELDLPTALKFGAGERSEIFVEFSPWVHVQHDLDGHSDLLLGGRHRFVDGGFDGLSLAVQSGVDLPIGDDLADTGYTDGFAAAIATRRWNTLAVTAFYQLGAIGQGDARFDFEQLGALAVACSFDQRVGAFAEVAGVLRPEFDSEAAVFTAGLTYATSPGCVLDLAVADGRGDDAPDLQVFLGATIGLGRLFGGP